MRGRFAVQGLHPAFFSAPVERRPALKTALPLLIDNGLLMIASNSTKPVAQTGLPSYAPPGSRLHTEQQLLLPGHIFGIPGFHIRGRSQLTATISDSPYWILRVDTGKKAGAAWLGVASLLLESRN